MRALRLALAAAFTLAGALIEGVTWVACMALAGAAVLLFAGLALAIAGALASALGVPVWVLFLL